jgi:hypothetical protein
MKKYPVGIQDFLELRKGGYVYVDKTMFAHTLVSQGKYYFLSRPRRFGKSLFMSMLQYLFEGNKNLFEGLYIEDKWDWTQNSPVIKISFSDIGHKDKGLYRAISDCLDEVAKKHNITLQETVSSSKFRELISTLSIQQGKVVVLIDEYDKPIIDYLGVDAEKAIENRDILKSFYSILKDADPYLKWVLITGVSKFARTSIFSDLNHLRELSLNPHFSSICGISQAELDFYFKEELALLDVEKIKKWYNGYNWGGKITVYNPFSLLNFFVDGGHFENYWFVSGTPTFLLNLAKKYQKYDFEKVKISATRLNAYDIENLQLIPLMFQTGYLTISRYIEEDDLYELNYPNEEVRKSYLEVLADAYAHSNSDTILVLATEMRDALNIQDFGKVESIFNTVFKSIPYEVWQKENEHYYHAIIHLTFRLLGIYTESQVQTSDGRIDAIVQLKNYVYAFEFKLSDNNNDDLASKALQQIKHKNYLQPYFHQHKTCIGVGLSFSKELKKVEKICHETLYVHD